MDAMGLWIDGKMGKLRNISGMNVVTGSVEAGIYERTLRMAQNVLDNMGYLSSK